MSFDFAAHRMCEQRWFDDFRPGERFVLPSRTTGVLAMRSEVVNQDGIVVQDGMQKYLLRRRPADEPSAAPPSTGHDR